MRRDVFHFYNEKVENVYKAYANAIYNEFDKSAKKEPYHTIGFGLSYSFKYNMNGGTCTVHFMPHHLGTAVYIRYTIIKAFGARYQAHDKDLTTAVEKILGKSAKEIYLDSELFLKPENKKVKPIYEAKDLVVNTTLGLAKFCSNCGNKFDENDKFCCKCGTKQ